MMKYIVYIGFALVAIACALVELFVKNKTIKMISFISVLVLFFLLGSFKGLSVGTDTQGYSETYDSALGYTFLDFIKKNTLEYGFYGLMYVFSFLRIKFKLFLAFNYLLICTSLFFAFFKHERKTLFLVLFMFIGFFCMSFSGIRQAVAISLGTLAFSIYSNPKIKNMILKLITYVVLVAMATLFHRASLVLLVVLILSLVELDLYQVPYIPLLIGLAFTFLFGRIFILGASIFTKNTNTEVFNSRVSVTLVFEVVFVALFYLLYATRIGEKIRNKIGISNYSFRKIDSFYMWIIYLGLIFMAFNTATTIFTRVSMYFFAGITYFLVGVVETIEKPLVRNVYIAGILLFLGAYFVYSTPDLGLTPYVIG